MNPIDTDEVNEVKKRNSDEIENTYKSHLKTIKEEKSEEVYILLDVYV